MTLTISNPFRSKPSIKPYTPDDLPEIIRGRVTEEDMGNMYKVGDGSHRSTIQSCAVATALKRMFPGIDNSFFSIGVVYHSIGRRRYEADKATQQGIADWANSKFYEFDFTLTEY